MSEATYSFPENIHDLVYSKDYAQVIRLTEDGDIDRQEVVWRVNNLHGILLMDADRLYDISFWREHYTALQSAIAETESNDFHHTLQHYLRQLKTICLRDTVHWIGEQIVESVKENRYDFIAAICRGVIKSGYVPIEPEDVFWIGIEAVLQGKALAMPDNVQLALVTAFIQSVAEVDDELARNAYMKAYRDNEAQSFKMLQHATADNAVGQLGPYEIRWPGFTTMKIPRQDTSHKRAEINALALQVAKNVATRYMQNFTGDLPEVGE